MSDASDGNYFIERDEVILEHVMRYRITTPEVLHRMEIFQGSERNAVTKVTTRLCDDQCLQKWTLYGPYRYFTLGRKWARRNGVPLKKIKDPLPPTPLYEAYGALSFCCLGDELRERIPVSELARNYPQLLARGIESSPYYFDEVDNVRRLGFIWTTAGADAKYIADAAVRRVFQPRSRHPGFKKWIDDGLFVIAIVTFSEEKKAAIIEALQKVRLPCFVRVEVFPALLDLLPRS